MQGARTKGFFPITLSLLASIFAIQISARAQTADQAELEAQMAKGRQVVAEVCSACHTTITRMVEVHKQTADEWKSTVYFMISRGAQVMPDEIEPVVTYLAATGGKGPAQTTNAGRGGGARGGQTAQADSRALFQQTCQQCHELAMASSKMPSEEWSAVITRMMTYGARLSASDQQRLTEYLNGLSK
jgi:mono/diheme cytochrome c family protein